MVMKQRPKLRLERRSADWLCHLDERLLEALDEAEDPMTAWQLAFDIESPSRMRVRERCRVLADAGFVVVLQRLPMREQYEITSWGERYLEGEVDADLRRPVPAPRPPGKMRPSEFAGFG